jgi:hypothetical protein
MVSTKQRRTASSHLCEHYVPRAQADLETQDRKSSAGGGKYWTDGVRILEF